MVSAEFPTRYARLWNKEADVVRSWPERGGVQISLIEPEYTWKISYVKCFY